MSSTHSAIRLIPVIAVGFILGCASTPVPSPVPPAPTPRTDTTVPVPQQLVVQPVSSSIYREGSYTYGLQQTTTIAIGTDSSIARMEDTLTTAGSLTYVIRTSGDTLGVTAVVDSLTITSTRDTLAPPRRLVAPVTFVLRPGHTEITQLPDSADADSTAVPLGCDSMEDAAHAIARDIHVTIPAGIQRGQRWVDSASTTICRGNIPMRAVTLSSFEVRDVRSRSDSMIARVSRRSTLKLSGSGMQGSRRIAVTGNGTSETEFTYDLRAGAFIESVGQSALELRFETTQQTELVTQRSSSRVHLQARSP